MEASEGKLSFFARDDFRHFASKASTRAGDHDRFAFEIQNAFTSPTHTGPDTRPAIGQHGSACLHELLGVSEEAFAVLREKMTHSFFGLECQNVPVEVR